MDHDNSPFAVISLAEAHKQGLAHRAVLVMVFNAEAKLYLQKRSSAKALYPGRWDLSATGHVTAGESAEDAAIRELKEELGIALPRLKLVSETPATPLTGNEFVTLFSAGRVNQAPRPNSEEIETGMFVDREELASLVLRHSDQLTPGLVFFWKNELAYCPEYFRL